MNAPTHPRLVAAGVALAAVSAVTPARAAADWPELPEPPRSTVEWVARDSRINGLPSRIERFESELSVDEVLAHYRRLWRTAAVGAPQQVSRGDWQALSTWQGTYQLVVQVQARKPQGSQGMVSAMQMGTAPRDVLPADWPRWRDTRITQVTESDDGPLRSHLVAMVSSEGFDVNLARWRDVWQRRGFAQVHDHKAPAGDKERSWIGSFNRADESVDVVMTWREADRRTFISVNAITPVPGASR